MRTTELSESARAQAELWGQAGRDWAELVAVVATPIWHANLDAARVTRGCRVVDLACGSGEALVLADLRGAEATGVDVSERLLDIARQRLPDADIRRAELDSLPFDDGTFDAATAANAIMFAADPDVALTEAFRVLRPGGRLSVSVWGPDDVVDYVDVMRRMYRLTDQPEPESYFPLGSEGVLEEMLGEAGFEVTESGSVEVPFVWVDEETFLAAQAATGAAQRIIGNVGRAAFYEAMLDVGERYRQDDGSYRFENQYQYVAGMRPVA
jgi:SAM-dependent methyltransferase